MMRAALLALPLAIACATNATLPILDHEPTGCERLGVVWQAPPFPWPNDWRAGLEAKAIALGADTLVLRHRTFGFAMAGAWRCGA